MKTFEANFIDFTEKTLVKVHKFALSYNLVIGGALATLGNCIEKPNPSILKESGMFINKKVKELYESYEKEIIFRLEEYIKRLNSYEWNIFTNEKDKYCKKFQINFEHIETVLSTVISSSIILTKNITQNKYFEKYNKEMWMFDADMKAKSKECLKYMDKIHKMLEAQGVFN